MTAEQVQCCVIAYEPFGHRNGKDRTAEQAQEVCGAIREQLRSLYGARISAV